MQAEVQCFPFQSSIRDLSSEETALISGGDGSPVGTAFQAVGATLAVTGGIIALGGPLAWGVAGGVEIVAGLSFGIGSTINAFS